MTDSKNATTSANDTATIWSTSSPGRVSASTYSLAISESDQVPSQVMVDVSPISLVYKLSACNNISLYPATASNFSSNPSIPYISCDSDWASIKQFLDEAYTFGVPCVVFYSENNAGCGFSPGIADRYRNIPNMFTMLSSNTATQMLSILFASSTIVATITSDVGSSTPTTTGTPPANNRALIALYTVVAVVAVFLVVIVVAGVIRLRRHPERYGMPPGLSGSYSMDYTERARGLARAVLDTLPLVRVTREHHKEVGDTADVETGARADAGAQDAGAGDAGARDAESDVFYDSASVLEKAVPEQKPKAGSASGSGSDPAPASESDPACTTAPGPAENPDVSQREPTESTARILHINPQQPEEQPATSYANTDMAMYVTQQDDSCPICFELFDEGEVLRVLPCQHKFHASCVDPWLLKESSQCPLCRVDLALAKNPNAEPNEIVNESVSRRWHWRSNAWRRFVSSRRQLWTRAREAGAGPGSQPSSSSRPSGSQPGS